MADEWSSDLLSTWEGASQAVPIAHPVFLPALPATPTIAGISFNQINGLFGTVENRLWFLEKQGLILEANGIRPSEWKLLTAIYPIITGPVGLEVIFYLGGEIGQPQSGVEYQGPYSYIIGTDTKIDCLVTCRYPAFKLSCETNREVNLQAIGFEFELIGED